ncbi:glycosyltransferase family 2 protein [Puteibacter caeruleilacunae]|nr:glycosyltransferase family 2 protein [Puteibacter caeruleilacunae]
MPSVAIVILNWNGVEHLSTFLPSVIQHSTQDNIRIIVADNGSTDDSVAILTKKYPEVEILELPENYGFAKGYNEALKQIQADYYILLNSDVEVTDNWINPVVNLMEQEEQIACCQPKVKAWKDKSHFEHAGAAGGFLDKFGYPLCRGRILDYAEEDKGQYDDSRSIFWATGACLFIKASLFHKMQGFDEDFWAHMEEIDLCWRLKNKGYKIMYCAQSTVYHLGGASLSYQSPLKVLLNFRNNLFMLYKNLPAKKLLPILLVRFILDGVAALKFLATGEFNFFKAVWKSHMQFYQSLSKLQQKRKALEKQRLINEHEEILDKSMILNFYLRGIKTFKS